jgi:hypothetical protein
VSDNMEETSSQRSQSRRPLLHKDRDRTDTKRDSYYDEQQNDGHVSTGSTGKSQRSSRHSPSVSIHKGKYSAVPSTTNNPRGTSYGATENDITTAAEDTHSSNNERTAGGQTNNGNLSDTGTKLSPDEFDERSNINDIANKITRTGRQRKKLAARTKGGEFQTKRKKKRVYFCCISSEIDLEKLQDAILAKPLEASKHYEMKMYQDVLHVFICDHAETTTPSTVGEKEESSRERDLQKQESFDAGMGSPPRSMHTAGILKYDNIVQRLNSGDVPDSVQSAGSVAAQSSLKLWTG